MGRGTHFCHYGAAKRGFFLLFTKPDETSITKRTLSICAAFILVTAPGSEAETTISAQRAGKCWQKGASICHAFIIRSIQEASRATTQRISLVTPEYKVLGWGKDSTIVPNSSAPQKSAPHVPPKA